MQRFVLVLGALAVVIGASKEAKAFGVGADFGYSRVLVEDAKDLNGFGGDLYIRPLPLPIIDPEIQLGWHHFSQSNNGADASFAIYPLLAGARLDLPVIPVFVGAHVGVIGNHYKVTGGPSASDAFTNTNWDFGFNVGGGWNFLSLPLIKLGIGAWYYVVPKNHSGSGKGILARFQHAANRAGCRSRVLNTRVVTAVRTQLRTSCALSILRARIEVFSHGHPGDRKRGITGACTCRP